MAHPPRHSARFWLPLPDDLEALAPADALERLRGARAPWLLESALRDGDAGRFSFCGADPYLELRGMGDDLEWLCHRAVCEGLERGRRVERERPLLAGLRSALPRPPGDDAHLPDIPFCGGAVGAFGYELAEQLDVHRLHGRDDLALPEAVWLFVDSLVAFDHATGRAGISGLGMADSPSLAEQRARAAAERLLWQLRAPRPHGARVAPTSSASPEIHDVADYLKAVDQLLDAIAEGELYQACLTYRVEAPFAGDPWQLYRRLAQRDPAPFAAFLELPELSIVSSSPERFLRVGADGRVESRPIKGTARRGADPESDAAAHRRLAASAKDRAENLMIVDLVRHDLGRVCEVGSVEVPSLFEVESRAAVHHLVSTVRGRLRGDCDSLDAVAASFPPGSMTGAPKIAAMRWLDRLERNRRGFYSGALGYLDARGGADLSVVIRSAFVRNGRVWLHTGGGIVADSEPTAEYAETRDKLRAMRSALAEG